MFLNPKRKKSKGRSRRTRRNPLGRSGNTASRSKYPPTQSTMAKTRKKHQKTRTARRKLSVRVSKSRKSARITLRARRGRGAGKLRIRRIKSTGASTTFSVKANPRRSRHARRNPVRRRHARRNPMGGNLISQFKGVFSKDNLTVAAGAIAGTVVTTQIVTRFGDSLPLINSTNDTTRKIGVLTYDVGLPLIGAAVVRKFSPNLAKGMVIAALVNGINDAMKMFAAPVYTQLYSPVKSAGAYLNYQNIPNVLPVGDISSSRSPGYSGMNAMATIRPTNGALDNSRAFPADAWN